MMAAPSLADRMKAYEDISCAQHLIPNLPICLRVDGKAFHTWCRGLDKPYDARLHHVMDAVTAALVDLTHAVIGYTASDEISLVLWNYGKLHSDIYFHGRRDKLVSVTASAATHYFSQALGVHLPHKVGTLALFDARAWNVPTPHEAINYLLWREQDATRNSLASAAQALFSPRQLHGKDGRALHEMLWQQGVNWHDYPARFKRGCYVKRCGVTRAFTSEEVAQLPRQHAARTPPDLVVQRHEVKVLALPPLGSVANPYGVIFGEESPRLWREVSTTASNTA